MLSEQKRFLNEETELSEDTLRLVVFLFSMKLLDQSIQVERKGEQNER